MFLFGPKRVGKTTLVRKLLEDRPDDLFIKGEDLFIREILSRGIDRRNDQGVLWGNYLVTERIKKQEYATIGGYHFFGEHTITKSLIG